MKKKERDQFAISEGNPRQLGAVRCKDAVNFALDLPQSGSVQLFLYHPGDEEPFQEVTLSDAERTGSIGAVKLDIPEGFAFEYAYVINGKLLPDPYARAVRTYTFDVEAKSRELAQNDSANEKSTKKEPTKRSTDRVTRALPDPEYHVSRPAIARSYSESVFYKLHVRGFTMDESAHCAHPGTFRGIEDKIPYFKKLGINALILMPCYEFEEMAEDARVNYWGYTGGLYYVVKQKYAYGDDPGAEFAHLIETLHANEIECIMEMYFAPEMPLWRMTDILHYWKLQFQIDGFRLVGYGRWILAAASDPILSFTKLFYVNRREGIGDAMPANLLADYNQNFQFAIRRFLIGEDVPELGSILTEHGQSRVNYLADQDGMTLHDLFAYSEKHNEANGEDNRDGTDFNASWNCGIEGETKKRTVMTLRAQMMRNAFMLLMISQAPPMLQAGDECYNSQAGNNNAWCQDNPTGWVRWNKNKAAKELQSFVSELIRFRMQYPVLHRKHDLRRTAIRESGIPEVSYHGSSAWSMEGHRLRSALGILYYQSPADNQEEAYLFFAINLYHEPQEFALPDLPNKACWTLKIDTNQRESFIEGTFVSANGKKQISVAPRSIRVLISAPRKSAE